MITASGTYTGNGSNPRTISGVGFQPDVVLIKATTSSVAGIRYSTESVNEAKPFSNDAPVANLINSFTSDGFVVHNYGLSNENGITYHWFAAKMEAADSAVFSYTGDGTDNRNVGTLSFTPAFVMIFRDTIANNNVWRTDQHSGDSSQTYSAAATTNQIQALNSGSIQVGTGLNTNGAIYHVWAVAAVAGMLSTAEYTGDGTDNRNIAHGLGATPILTLIQRQTVSGEPMVGRFKDHAGDLSSNLPAAFSSSDSANWIQAVDGTNVQVGTDGRVNTNTAIYTLVSFGQVDPAPAANVSGVLATAQAAALAAAVEAQKTTSISGAIAAAAPDAPAGSVLIGGIDVAGVVAQSAAAALAPVIETVQQGAIAGEIAQATADVLAAAFALSRSVSGAIATVTAAALEADIVTSSPTIAAVIAEALVEALAADIDTVAQPIIAGAVAEAQAAVRPADVVTTFIEPPIGSGGGGAVGGGSGSVGTGGSPAGFNYGVCALDFAIDEIFLSAMPLAIERIGPKHEIRTSPRGYALPSLREGREWRFQWGEQYVDIATVSELRWRLGTSLTHAFSWTEPDTTPMEIIGSIKEVEYQWSQDSPGFYSAVILHVLEHER